MRTVTGPFPILSGLPCAIPFVIQFFVQVVTILNLVRVRVLNAKKFATPSAF